MKAPEEVVLNKIKKANSEEFKVEVILESFFRQKLPKISSFPMLRFSSLKSKLLSTMLLKFLFLPQVPSFSSKDEVFKHAKASKQDPKTKAVNLKHEHFKDKTVFDAENNFDNMHDKKYISKRSTLKQSFKVNF